MKVFLTVINYMYYGIYMVVLIGNLTGVFSVPWSYALIPVIMLGVTLSLMYFALLNNEDNLLKQTYTQNLIETLEKRGYTVKKKISRK